MYDGLIVQIRQLQHWFKPNGSDQFDPYVTLGEAAVAIEELSKKYLDAEVDNTNLTGWLAEEHAKHLWIPVTERLPEVRTWVLCFCRANSFDVFRMTDEGHWQYGNRSIYMKGYVTHWMPLPEPPKEE